jgi:1-deoxy-D-xylulose-5-phosphate reductoisomerase
MPRRIVILGCTGSIGRQALEVVDAVCTDDGRPGLQVVALVANTNVQGALDQARRHDVPLVAFHDETAAAEAKRTVAAEAAGPRPPLRVLCGDEGIAELITEAAESARAAGEPLTVLNGIVGAAGLRATMVALQCGATLALANKESMVAGGRFVLRAAHESGAAIIPVDSEHSAIFQCLAAGRPVTGDEGGSPLLAAEEILLTGSGGPFRGYSSGQLAQVTPDQALRHPNWVMGPKVTIDSATLMNKGLEVIEAHYLFAVPYAQIRVVIHPQSIVHSLVRYADGALLAHLGVPDMRTPIGYALTYPRRAPLPMVNPLELAAREISFAEPNVEAFPCLRLAREAGERGAATNSGAPVVLNAANEVAVHAFLEGRISFPGIAAHVERALEQLGDAPLATIDDVFALDAETRRLARGLLPDA